MKQVKRTLQPVEGYVYCDHLGEIHEDELDPYQYGEPEPGEEDMRCKPEHHVKVYARQWAA